MRPDLTCMLQVNIAYNSLKCYNFIMKVASLSRELNNVARNRFPALHDQLGLRNPLIRVLPRMALRQETKYPYALTQDDKFYPRSGLKFGRVIEASWQEGVEAIHSEITTRELEHSWVYVHGTEMWVDNTLSATGADCDQDQLMTTFLSYIGSDLTDVHTHPDKVVQKVAAETPWLDYGSDYRGGAAAPSGNDLIHLCQMSARVNTEVNYGAAVVSHYGVASYELASRSIAHDRGIALGPVDLRVDPIDPVNGIHSMLAQIASTTTYMLDTTPALKTKFASISM